MPGSYVPADYMPVLLFMILATAMGFGLHLLGEIIRPRRPYREKLMPYESGSTFETGVTPLVEPTRYRFSVKFYMIAILFVVFDVEAIFLFPWAIVFDRIKGQITNSYYGTLNSSILDSIITDYITSEHIPGATALIFYEDGDVLWSGNYGYKNLQYQLPVEDSTYFLMASISKTFIATAIMQLWENGLINLDASINDYLPSGFVVVNPNYPNDTITVKMLMLHTSSLKDNWDILFNLWACGDYPVSVDSFLVNYFTPGGAYYSSSNFYGNHPGDYWNYSNASVSLLALIIRNLTGKNFDEYTRDSILTPLSMNSSSWFLDGMDTSKIATPYRGLSNPPQAMCHIGFAYWPVVQLRTNKLELAKSGGNQKRGC